MSSPRYCDNPEPHDGHEWSLTTEPGPVWSGGTDYFYCWGVKSDAHLEMAVHSRNVAKNALDRAEKDLRKISERYRRTQAEFYGGNGTKCEVCLDQGWLKDVPCEGCGKKVPS